MRHILERKLTTYQLVPVNWYSSAIDVGRVFVLEVLQARVARFLNLVSEKEEGEHDVTDLSIACLEAEMEKPADAVLSRSWGVVEDESKAIVAMLAGGLKMITFQTHTLYTYQCPAR